LESTEEQIADPGFWNSQETSQRVMQERKRLEKAVAEDAEVRGLTEEIETLFELGREGEAVVGEIAQELKKLAARLEVLEAWHAAEWGERPPKRDFDRASGRGRDGEPGLGSRCCCGCFCGGRSGTVSVVR
jgi:hypothetical protein